MSRFIPSPVRGHGTWTAGPTTRPTSEPIARPAARWTSGVPVDVDGLPRGDLTLLELDGEEVDLWMASVERVDVDVDVDGATAVLGFVLDEGYEARPGLLLRLTLVLTGVTPEFCDPDLVARDSRLATVDALQHDGRGGLRLSAGVGEGFGSVQLRAQTMELAPEWLDARRPPHVLVMWDYTAFGVWDDGPGMGPFEADDLDLPPALRDRIETWCARCEAGDEDRREQRAIADELRRAWPHSVVRVQP